MNDLVLIHNNQAVVSSRVAAEKFNKKHHNVLQSIEHIVKTEKSVLAFYEKHQYKVKGQFRTYPEYYMNRDGFMLLVMGFTTKPAMQVKIAFIKAFNEMEAKLKVKAEVPNEKLIAAYQKNIQQLVKRNEELELKWQLAAPFATAGLLAHKALQDEKLGKLALSFAQGYSEGK